MNLFQITHHDHYSMCSQETVQPTPFDATFILSDTQFCSIQVAPFLMKDLPAVRLSSVFKLLFQHLSVLCGTITVPISQVVHCMH